MQRSLGKDLQDAAIQYRQSLEIRRAGMNGAVERLQERLSKSRGQFIQAIKKAEESHAKLARGGGILSLMGMFPGWRRALAAQADLFKALRRKEEEETAEISRLLDLVLLPHRSPGKQSEEEFGVSKPDAPAGRRRRILVDLRGLRADGSNGGLEAYVCWLFPRLRQRHGESLQFLALATEANWSEVAGLFGPLDGVWVENSAGQIHRRAGDEGPVVLGDSLPAKELAERLEIDVTYSPLGPLPFVLPGVRSVALLVDLLHREIPSALPPDLVAKRENWFKDVVGRADRIQCISNSVQERLERHYPAVKGKTFRTYLPIHARLQAAPSETEVDLKAIVPGLAQDTRYFFYPANFWPHKNHRALLAGYHKYVRESNSVAQPWHLVLTGADFSGEREAVWNLARSLGISNRVHVTGYVADGQLEQIWRHAGALIFPSLHEGFGIPLLEAMQYGVPILSATGYSLGEIAGDSALYFNPSVPEEIARIMEKAAASPDFLSRLAAVGQDRLKGFDPDRELERLVAEWFPPESHDGGTSP